MPTPQLNTEAVQKLYGRKLPWLVSFFLERRIFSRANRFLRTLFEDGASKEITHYIDRSIKLLDVKINDPEIFLQSLPKSGALIIAANHPDGWKDTLVLSHLTLQKRPDTKILSNDFFAFVFEGAETLLPLTSFYSSSSSMRTSLHKALAHLQGGGVVIIFPAGEVATRKISKHFSLTEAPWKKGILWLAEKSQAPILPVYISGENSWGFHLASWMHPLLRAICFFSELFKKKEAVSLAVGPLITETQLARFPGDAQQTLAYLRARVLVLGQNTSLSKQPIRKLPPIAAQQALSLLVQAIEQLPAESLLIAKKNYRVYVVAPGQSSVLLNEIGRLREIAFRDMDEGLGQPVDLDQYDDCYHQLVLWDVDQQEMLGGMRFAFLKDLLKRPIDLEQKFYGAQLVEIEPALFSILQQSLSLGRTFICVGYQKISPVLISLLWRAVMKLFLQCSTTKYLVGFATLSKPYSPAILTMVNAYLVKHYLSPLSTMVKAKQKLELTPDIPPILRTLAEEAKSIPELQRLLEEIDPTVPKFSPLLKHYLHLNTKILTFVQDQEFNSIDAMVLLRFSDLPLQQKMYYQRGIAELS